MNLFENLCMMKESEEVKVFNISFKANDVYQANLIKGYSEEQVIEYFKAYKPNAEVLGVKVATKDDERPGKPVIDATKDVVKEVDHFTDDSTWEDTKDIENIVESTELKPFTDRDHLTWGGEHNFADGSEPMIVDGEFATILVGQSDEQVGTEDACISIYYGDPESDAPQWGFKNYINKESAIKDARFLAKLADEEIDEEQLKRFGFEIVA